MEGSINDVVLWKIFQSNLALVERKVKRLIDGGYCVKILSEMSCVLVELPCILIGLFLNSVVLVKQLDWAKQLKIFHYIKLL